MIDLVILTTKEGSISASWQIVLKDSLFPKIQDLASSSNFFAVPVYVILVASIIA